MVWKGESRRHSLAKKGVKTSKLKAKGNSVVIDANTWKQSSQFVNSLLQYFNIQNDMTTPQNIGFPEGFTKQQVLGMLLQNIKNDHTNFIVIMNGQGISVDKTTILKFKTPTGIVTYNPISNTVMD